MTTLIEPAIQKHAQRIAPLSHAEAGVLAQQEYEQVLAVLEQLQGEDWNRPTYCTEWNVRQMVAHLAGAVTGSTTLGEFWRQNVANPELKGEREPVDGTNKLQIQERTAATPAELIEEYRRNGQIAVRNRQALPWLIRNIRLPMGSLGFASIEYLMDTIYTRDQWMHRYDLCAATGKHMVITPGHDERLVALVLLDIEKKLKRERIQHTVALRLTGEIQINYLFGDAAATDCTLAMDVFDFNLRASGRISADEAVTRANIAGDHAAAQWFLDKMTVPY